MTHKKTPINVLFTLSLKPYDRNSFIAARTMSTPTPLPTTQQRQLQLFTTDVNVKPIIREHLVSLFDSYPTLYPKSLSFTRTNGLCGNYLSLIGTIPMVHLGVTYHAPIVIKVMETYPHYAPLVFVNPDRRMVINKKNPFVCPSGLVLTDYLAHWVSTSSNLLDLCRDLSTCFGNNPPLYSKLKRNPKRRGSFVLKLWFCGYEIEKSC